MPKHQINLFPDDFPLTIEVTDSRTKNLIWSVVIHKQSDMVFAPGFPARPVTAVELPDRPPADDRTNRSINVRMTSGAGEYKCGYFND